MMSQQNQLQTPAAAGYKRRGVLAILTARYVQPIWQQVIPSESATQEDIEATEPTHALLQAQQILTGQIRHLRIQVNGMLERLLFIHLGKTLLRIMETENIDQTWPIFAGWSALTALGEKHK